MASNIIRHIQKSCKQSPLGIKLQQSRCASNSSGPNPTTSTTTTSSLPPIRSTPAPPPTSSVPNQQPIKAGSNLMLAVGLSLGIGVTTLISQNGPLKRYFAEPEPPKQDKVVTTIDPKLMEHVISQDRKVNQLENQLSSLRDELRERDAQQHSNQTAQATQTRVVSNGNVFELSEVIQANNLASAAKHSKELEDQRKMMVREHMLKVEGEILKVENKYRPVINKIRELESHLENQRQVQQKEAPARLLWLSCQSLMNRMLDSPQQPLEKDPAYDLLRRFAANDNELAARVLDSIPAHVLKQGVHSEESLIDRFTRLEKVCRRVSMVDAHGAGLGKYIISYMQSLFIMNRSQIISEAEITGQQLVDPTKWTTFDILARVHYCLSRKNLEQAVRYANQLKGQARVVARDWIRDARTHLVTRQALSALSAHAEAIAVDTTTNTSNHGNPTSFASQM